ncbi:T9SS type A sorting domain-containing protein [Fluviicola sp.]|uniref:T9SS type A sorting domain-containing protein n=1 Tax=Fluviicola sp. TaxID=1917219 RepID=UPI002628468C|nr:T9SS type A sorting domain-containing protein [Fluviicola sp.]
MKTCLTILLSVIFYSMAQGQYRYLRNYNDDVHTLIPCQDSTYYAISIHPGCGINSFSIHYLGRHGQVIWSKESNTWGGHLFDFKGYTDENNTVTLIYYSNGNNGLTRIDRNGNVLFNKVFNQSTYKMSTITPATDGFYLTGKQNESSSWNPSVPVLLKMNNSGDIVWVKSYTSPNIPRFLFRDVELLGDSLLIVGNYTQTPSPEVTFPCLLKTDLNGNAGSSFYYRIETVDVDRYKFMEVDSQDPGSIYLKFLASAGVDGILKLNGQLQKVWCQNISGELGAICASYDGGVLFTTGMSLDGDIMSLNAQGSFTGSKATDNLTSSTVPSMVLRHDCGYLVALPNSWPSDRYAHIPQNQAYCGNISGDQPPVYPISPVTRHPLTVTTQNNATTMFSLITLSGAFASISTTETIDCLEASNCNGPLGISEPEFTPDVLYPNPATDMIHIETNGSPITITDAAGSVVYSGTLTDGKLNIQFLASGLYHVKSHQQRGHFIKQ